MLIWPFLHTFYGLSYCRYDHMIRDLMHYYHCWSNFLMVFVYINHRRLKPPSLHFKTFSFFFFILLCCKLFIMPPWSNRYSRFFSEAAFFNLLSITATENNKLYQMNCQIPTQLQIHCSQRIKCINCHYWCERGESNGCALNQGSQHAVYFFFLCLWRAIIREQKRI